MNDNEIQECLVSGSKKYAEKLRERIPNFVENNFSLSGSLERHKISIGTDIPKSMGNVLMAIPNLGKKALSRSAKALGYGELAKYLDGIPMELKTELESELEWKIYSELLLLPYEFEEKKFESDMLLTEILDSEVLNKRKHQIAEIISSLSHDARASIELQLKKVLSENKDEANKKLLSALSIIGIGTSGSILESSIALGQAGAQTIAFNSAVGSFFAGPTLGSMFYSAFPSLAAPSGALVAASSIGVFSGLAVLSAFSGIVTDPILKSKYEKGFLQLANEIENMFKANNVEQSEMIEYYYKSVRDLDQALTFYEGLLVQVQKAA